MQWSLYCAQRLAAGGAGGGGRPRNQEKGRHTPVRCAPPPPGPSAFRGEWMMHYSFTQTSVWVQDAMLPGLAIAQRRRPGELAAEAARSTTKKEGTPKRRPLPHSVVTALLQG
ncbi:hypothetical protein GCM10017711_23700 [Paeniglutamicibacter sulfureus]